MAGIQANPGSGSPIAFATIGALEYQITDEFLSAVGRGDVSGVSAVQKFGINFDIDTGTTPEDIWEGGGVYTGQPVSDSETVDIFSSDAADAAAGDGARTVTIQGLDENWRAASETLTMNGTTPVTSSGTWRRVNRAFVMSAGTDGANAGTITVRHTTTTTNVFVAMAVGYNQTNIAAYTVPDGTTGYLIGAIVTTSRASGAAGSATCTLRVRDTATADSVFRARETAAITESQMFQRQFIPIELPARSDIKWRCENVSDSSNIISGQFVLMLIDD